MDLNSTSVSGYACYTIPGVDYPVYSYAGRVSQASGCSTVSASGALVPTRRKIQQIVLLTLSLRRQQMRPIIHSSLIVGKDATTVELAAQAGR